MKKTITIILSILFCSKLFSQTMFQRVFDGPSFGISYGFEVDQTNDGGYVICGRSFDGLLIKVNSDATQFWAKEFEGINPGADYIRSVQQTSDGGYVMAGNCVEGGVNQFVIMKTNSNGSSLLWGRQFGTASHDEAYCVRQTTDGGYIMAGKIDVLGYPYLVKVSSTGNMSWNRAFGGTSSGAIYSVQQTADGGYITVGNIGSDVYLVKVDNNPSTYWTKTYGGTNNDDGRSVQQTSDGGYIISGITASSGAGNKDIWLIKTDSDGGILWSKTMGGSNNDYSYGVQQTTDGGYVVVGTTYSWGAGTTNQICLVKTDSDGSLQWAMRYGGTSASIVQHQSVQQTGDGGYVMAGYISNFPNGFGAGPNAYLIKTNSNGSSGCYENSISFTVSDYTCTVGSLDVDGSQGGSAADGWRGDVIISGKDACTGTSLPIELLTFTAKWLDVSQTDALLEWSTASETNNSHFEIQRSQSPVASNQWQVVGTVPGAGNSSSVLNYQYIDNGLPEPTKADVFYYRLKQTDFNGQFTYSNIEVLTRGSITVIGPAPNPINDNLSFSVLSAVDGAINVRIITALGQMAYKETFALRKGIQQIKIPLALASGMYMLFVETSDGAERIQKEFVIK